MKILKAYVVADAASDLSSFDKAIENMTGLELAYETNMEAAVNAFTQQSFDLLIVDKNLSGNDFKKLHTLAGLLHPDAAIVDFVLTDEAFIRYKLNGMLAKWIDAQGESKVNFIDNPDL